MKSMYTYMYLHICIYMLPCERFILRLIRRRVITVFLWCFKVKKDNIMADINVRILDLEETILGEA